MKKKSPYRTPPPKVAPRPLLSLRGKKSIAGGIALLIIGFSVLTRTDPSGQNWASLLSPLLLITGYLLIGLGTVLQDPFGPVAPAGPVPSQHSSLHKRPK